jgi:hypothetical protein
MVWKRQRGRTDRTGADGLVAPPARGSAETAATPDAVGSPMADPTFLQGLRPIPTGGLEGRQPWPATDIVGSAPSGEALHVSIDDFAGPLLVVFLSLHCDGCDGFWDGLRDDAEPELPEGVDVVVVTKGETAVSRSEVARAATGIGRVPVVMSDQAWADYHVLGYPFFALVDAPTRSVVAETVGFGWSDVAGLLS